MKMVNLTQEELVSKLSTLGEAIKAEEDSRFDLEFNWDEQAMNITISPHQE